MKVPDGVSYILQKLDEMGFSSYAVGGCVRDTIMGKEPKDWDIATSAEPEEVKKLFVKTCDTGIKHGTVTVVLDENRYEVTTFREDGEYKDYRRPENVVFSKRIEDDLKRRDFTVNAIAWNIHDGYIDPFGGIKDIELKLIRGVGNPSDRFREDALRMLRAVRFSAKLGFIIEDNTSAAIVENASLINKISAERIHGELAELLSAPCHEIIFKQEFIALIEYMSPPLAKSLIDNKDSLSGFFEDCKKTNALRFAVLIYYMDSTDADVLLKQLKMSNRDFDRISKLHKVQNEHIGSEYYDVAKKVYEWGVQTFEDYLYFQMLNCIRGSSDLNSVLRIEENYRLIAENDFPVFVKDLALNGYDLTAEFKITGMAIGRTLEGLLDFVHRNPDKNTYEELIKQANIIIMKG